MTAHDPSEHATPDTPPGAAARPHSTTEALARVGITLTAKPGDPVMGHALSHHGAAEVWHALNGDGSLDLPGVGDPATVAARIRRWRERARETDLEQALTVADDAGFRLIVPGDPEWPQQLDALAEHRPYALWARGGGDVRYACLRSVAVVGSRAASDYGNHVATELGYTLAERGWSVVSGGAYGIDAAAHRGAVAARGMTVAVLACGLDIDYPRGHENLFADIATRGALLTELPPGTRPRRDGFLVRNRVIAALTPGTVVVEAGRRSGAMNTASHARELHRVVMAVPGPVTSAVSVGCHRLFRDYQASCVTDAADVIEQVGAIGEDVRAEPGGPIMSHADLDPVSRRVLTALTPNAGQGPAAVAEAAGCDIDTALRHLGLLAAGGFVRRTAAGWRAVTR